MKAFNIKVPYNNTLHDELTSLYGVLYRSQYQDYSIPVVHLETAYKTIFPYFPALASSLREKSLYGPVRTFYKGLKRNYKNYNRKESDFDFPCPKDITPRKYQRAGVEEILIRMEQGFKGCILGDDMGIGKTPSSIFLDNIKNYQKILVTSNASMLETWGPEWEKFGTTLKQLHVINPRTTTNADIINADVVFVSHDTLWRYKKILSEQPFDYVIVDEAQYFSSSTIKRSRALSEILNATNAFRLLLTGTPVTNYPKNLRNLLYLVDPDFIWHIQDEYEKYFCDVKRNKYGKNVNGASNLRLLSRIVKSCYLIRRMKDDVADQLPEKIVKFVPVEVSNSSVNVYQKILSKFSDLNCDLENISPKMLTDKTVQEARLQVGLEKIPKVKKFVDRKLKSDKPVVWFVYHIEVAQKLRKYYPNCCYIDGSTTKKKRKEEVDRFQKGESDLFILTFAGSEGITLTKSSHNVTSEFDWRLYRHLQSEDRTHRDGQENTCFQYYFWGVDSIDEYIIGKIGKKSKIIERLL